MNVILIFDLDGTLFDCSGIVGDAFIDGIKKFNQTNNLNLYSPTTSQIMDLVGLPTEEIFRRLFPDISNGAINGLIKNCQMELIDYVLKGKGYYYENIFEMIYYLKSNGYILKIASNGQIDYIEAVLKFKNIYGCFDKPIITIDGNNPTKSDIVRKYIVKAEKTSDDNNYIMIGDRLSDKNAASDNSIPFIGCLYGHNSDEISDSEFLINSISELTDVISKIVIEE